MKASDYYKLTKPGIIRGNLLTAAAGFIVGSSSGIDFGLFIFTMLGIACVIAAGCVWNNILDRNIDKKMTRTKSRATASGKVSVGRAAAFGSALALIGFGTLLLATNILTVSIGIVGIIFYVVFYGYAKRRTVFGTEVGIISGATPILAGYTAATGNIDSLGLLLFVLMALWQMPHFYAIAIFRLQDYKRAKIPVISAVKGIKIAQKRILVYILIYAFVALIGGVAGITSWTFSIGLAALGLFWLQASFRSYRSSPPHPWAQKNFGFSLVTLLIFSILVAFEAILP